MVMLLLPGQQAWPLSHIEMVRLQVMTTSPSGMLAMMVAIFEKMDWRFGRGICMQFNVWFKKMDVRLSCLYQYGGKRLGKNHLYALTGKNFDVKAQYNS